MLSFIKKLLEGNETKKQGLSGTKGPLYIYDLGRNPSNTNTSETQIKVYPNIGKRLQGVIVFCMVNEKLKVRKLEKRKVYKTLKKITDCE